MAAYAALVSLARQTHPTRNFDQFSTNAKQNITSIHEYVIFMISFLEEFPDKAKRVEDKMRDIAQKIEEIIEYMMPMEEQGGLLKHATEEIGLITGEMMDERLPPPPPPAAVPSSPSVTNSDAVVIGFDEDLMKIKDWLCGNDERLQLIPIVGMAGIGKTTLATTIYEDPLILERFDIRAWLTVSQDYSPHRLTKILLDLLLLLEQQLSENKVGASGEEKEEEVCAKLKKQVSGKKIEVSEMRTKVYQILKGRRYLIVMDDVWNTKAWDDVGHIFPDDKTGSRIILTTRELDVARYPSFSDPPHEMQFMNESHSWDLLKHKVFANNTNCLPELEDIGKDIARRCAGLPLSLVLVAGVMSAIDATRDSWEEIARSVNLVVEPELEGILSFSYTSLPHSLRPCFLFIGGFPEDEDIRASTLINLWVAEGFLKHQAIRSSEDYAEECLENLVKRNLVLVTSRKSDRKIKSCCLHDMVRALCITRAEEEKFLHVVKGVGDIPQGLMNERRISFNHSGLNSIWIPTIRTLLCFKLQNSSDCWATFLQRSRLLKVLNGVGCNQTEELSIPSQVFELFHLTYLSLIGSFSIPSQISQLVNLKTLVIHPTFRRQKKRKSRDYNNASHFSLPLEIWRMSQLRHLILYDPFMLPQPPASYVPDVVPLENLQTLSLVENLVWSEKMVQMIPYVKRLGLVYALNQEYHLQYLNHLSKLENLHVVGYKQFSWQGKNPSFPTTLQKLTLVGGGFPWKDMSVIGSLPNLQVLKLRDHACEGELWETSDEEFPQLKYLVIDRSHLGEWVTESSHFPRLRRLVLRSCESLGEIPESIGEISTLQHIELSYCTESLVESAKKIIEEQRDYGNYELQLSVEVKGRTFRHVPVLPATAKTIALRDAVSSLTSAQESGGGGVQPVMAAVQNAMRGLTFSGHGGQMPISLVFAAAHNVFQRLPSAQHEDKGGDDDTNEDSAST